MSENIHLSFQLHRTNLSLTSRTFSLKINNVPTFCEITQLWQYLKIVLTWSDEFTYCISTFKYVLNLRCRPPTPTVFQS